MTSTLRSEEWVVRPSFVPNGPTEPVTLLFDEAGITQLAGDPMVAWQTPWSEMSNVQLIRFRRKAALFATISSVRYCWRTSSLNDFDSLRQIVREHGGRVIRRKRHFGVVATVIVVVLASFAGTIGSFLNSGSSKTSEIANTRAINLTLKDLPSGSSLAASSLLSYLFGTSPVVISSTTTTQVPKNSAWYAIESKFQSCMGVSHEKDRVFGLAGQLPKYQVTSKVYGNSSYGGLEVISTSQYYEKTSMVQRDTKEMTSPNFGSCFVAANESILLSSLLGGKVIAPAGTTWMPLTFVKGWARGGIETIAVPTISSKLTLVIAVVTSGHYEVTLGGIVKDWPAAEPFFANLVNTLLARASSTTSKAV